VLFAQALDNNTHLITVDIAVLMLQFSGALVVGFCIGLTGIILNKIENESLRIKTKALWSTAWAIALVVISEYLHMPDCKYMASLFFGYKSLRVWG
jgi:hypothetical protein